jgi:hypothetical protein
VPPTHDSSHIAKATKYANRPPIYKAMAVATVPKKATILVAYTPRATIAPVIGRSSRQPIMPCLLCHALEETGLALF